MQTAARSARPFSLIAALLASSVLAACSITITEPARDHSNSAGRMQMNKPGSARFECVQTPSGQCHYALFTTRCQTASGEGGKPATTCTHQVFEAFTLAQGQTRAVDDLPGNYKQCMKVNSQPVPPNCD